MDAKTNDMTSIIDYRDYYNKELTLLTNEELVIRFNSQVGIRAWNVARQIYLLAIWNQFDRRKIDYSEIGNSVTLSFAKKVQLKDNKLEIINS